MKGTPDNTVVLHWDECQTSWNQLSVEKLRTSLM